MGAEKQRLSSLRVFRLCFCIPFVLQNILSSVGRGKPAPRPLGWETELGTKTRQVPGAGGTPPRPPAPLPSPTSPPGRVRTCLGRDLGAAAPPLSLAAGETRAPNKTAPSLASPLVFKALPVGRDAACLRRSGNSRARLPWFYVSEASEHLQGNLPWVAGPGPGRKQPMHLQGDAGELGASSAFRGAGGALLFLFPFSAAVRGSAKAENI